MIAKDFAKQFSDEWIAAWNSHDLERILSHYSDDFTIKTPMAVQLYPQSGGTVQGKEEVRNYWSIGLQHIPNLTFELLDVLTGVNKLTIYYRNAATGRKSAETMRFNAAGKVDMAIVTYSS